MAQPQVSPYTAPVTVYASVTAKAGAFVRDLSAADFTLEEDGQNRIIHEAVVDALPASFSTNRREAAPNGKLHEIELRAKTKDLTVRVARRYAAQ